MRCKHCNSSNAPYRCEAFVGQYRYVCNSCYELNYATSAERHSSGSVQRDGSALSSKQPIRANGVLIPADNSFEAINNFVHATPSPEYEELQWALLGLASSLEKAATCEAVKQMRIVEVLQNFINQEMKMTSKDPRISKLERRIAKATNP